MIIEIIADIIFGVEIIDIRIGRTDLTEQVSNNVYQRMRSEREKEAK